MIYSFDPRAIVGITTEFTDRLFLLIGYLENDADIVLGEFDNPDDCNYWVDVLMADYGYRLL